MLRLQKISKHCILKDTGESYQLWFVLTEDPMEST